MRLSLDEIKVAVSAARAYPKGGTRWVEDGKSCCADAISRFSPNEIRSNPYSVVPLSPRKSALVGISEMYHWAAGWGAKLDYDADIGHATFIGALQADPQWVADVLETIVKAAEWKPAKAASHQDASLAPVHVGGGMLEEVAR